MITVNDIVVPKGFEAVHLSVLILEIVVVAIAFFYIITGGYVVYMLHPQFHPHVLTIVTTLFISYFAISIPRLIIIFLFWTDGSRNFEIVSTIPYTIYLDALRTSAACTALLACMILVFERVIATIQIRTYEKQRSPFVLTLTLIWTWIFPLACCYSIIFWKVNIVCFLSLGLVIGIIVLCVFTKLTAWSENEYKRNISAYSLTVKFQLSENVRLGRIIKSALRTFLIGCFTCLAIAFFAIQIFPHKDLVVFILYHLYEFLFAFLPITLVISTMNANPIWKASFNEVVREYLNFSRHSKKAVEPIRILSLSGDVLAVEQHLHATKYFNVLENMWK